jgi:hypothetical protein
MKSRGAKKSKPTQVETSAKETDQVKFQAPLGSQERYAAIAARWGYQQTSPFMRRLMDAAEKGDPSTGVIQFFRGSDSLKSAA